MSLSALKPDRARLQEHLAAVARPRDLFQNPDNLQAVQSYIESKLGLYGYQVEKDAFSFQGHSFCNLIARRNPASGLPLFLVGAHFDAVPGTDGADDNASGVAALLEAARIVSSTNGSSSVEFAAFNGEEYGMVGSSHYARRMKRDGRKIAGMISLEMVGFTSQEKGSQRLPLLIRHFYPDTGNFLALVGEKASGGLLKTAKAVFREVAGLRTESLSVPVKGWFLPDVRRSDHSPFWDAGYPALLVTDTSFFRNPHYHSVSDKLETLDLDFLSKVTEGVAHLALSF